MRDGLPILLTDSLNPSYNNNEDYQGLFYQTGRVQDYSAAIRGGTEELNYRLGIGFWNEEGIIKETGLDRYSVNLNVSQQPWKRVCNQTIINASYTDRQPGSGDPGTSRGNFPVSIKDMNSSLLLLDEDQRSFLSGTLKDYYRTNRTLNAQGTNILNVDIWEGIAANSQISASYQSTKLNEFEPSTIQEDKLGKARYQQFQTIRTIFEHYLSYSRDIVKNHNLNVILGTSYEFSQSETMDISALGGSGDIIKTINGYRKGDINGSTSINENAMLSYYTRLGYRFLDRYQLDLNYRRDASSRFGRGSRWGSFPSVGAYWIFSEEPFMKFSKEWLTFAKIKYSIGINGTQFLDDYLRYNMYSLSYNGFNYQGANMNSGSYNGVLSTIPNFSRLADNNLSWQETVMSDLGVEFEFFSNRLYVQGNYINKNTNNLLFDVKFPDYTGFDQVKSNVAGMRNSGYELTIDGHVFPRRNDLTLQLTTGFSHFKNVVTKLPNGNRDYISPLDSKYGYVVGRPGPAFRGLQYEGSLRNLGDLPVNPYTGKPLDPTKSGTWGSVAPGYPMWTDVSGDYLVSDDADQDVTYTNHDPNPKFSGFFKFDFGYKEWHLIANSLIILGRDVYDDASQAILNRYDDSDWAHKAMLNLSDYDVWTPQNTNAYYPSILPNAAGVSGRYAFRPNTSMWWENGNYFKINDITLSYNFKKDWLKRNLGLERLYVFATVYNVWQWQASDKLIDASMVDSRGHSMSDGYPQPRKFTFGMNLEF